MPPTSVEPLIAEDENVSCVPGWTAPVFVIVNAWFAVVFVSTKNQRKRNAFTNPGHQDHIQR